MINCAPCIVHGPSLHVVALDQFYPTIIFWFTVVCHRHLLYLLSSFFLLQFKARSHDLAVLNSAIVSYILILHRRSPCLSRSSHSAVVPASPILQYLSAFFSLPPLPAVDSTHPIARLLDGFRYTFSRTPLASLHSLNSPNPKLPVVVNTSSDQCNFVA